MLALALLRRAAARQHPASIANTFTALALPPPPRLRRPLPLSRHFSTSSSPTPLNPNLQGAAAAAAPWRRLLAGRPLLASGGKWRQLLRERVLEPGQRSWTQLVQQGPLRSYRGSPFGGYSGRGGLNDAQAVVWGLIGANIVVFVMWQTVDRRFMMDHFMVSVDSVMSGRLHTLVTSAFSHASLDHLLPNMLGLYFFGSEIAQMFGGPYLLRLYLAAAVAGSLGHVLYSAFAVPWLEGVPPGRFNARHTPRALGASGAVNAIVLLHILLFPTRIIMVNFFIPVPAALFGIYLIGSDVWNVRNEGSRTAHAGHLGGALVGAAAWLRIRYRWR